VTDFSIIIPVRNDARRLADCLKSLRAAAQPGVEVIVADNGSVDDSPSVARRGGARLLELPDRNVSSVRNSAARSAQGSVLAFVDADHLVGTSWLSAARSCLQEADTGAVGAAYLPPPDGTWVQRMYGALRGQTVGRTETRWLGSGNMVVRRVAFEAVGGFDETLEACEDVDLCQRLRAAGWRVVADERLESTHLGDPPTLKALFKAERWRGRDNVRVSMRGGLTLRDFPSLAAPILALAAVIGAVVAIALAPAWGIKSFWIATTFLALGSVLPLLQAVRLSIRARGLRDLPASVVVAFVYTAARAAALVLPGRHHRR
jgi:hypothetical protein